MDMSNQVTEPLKVAIIAKSSRQRLNLKSILEINQLQVVPDDELVELLSNPDGARIADVLLVDLDESDESGDEELDIILEKIELPILFNDGAATRNQYSTNGLAWGRRLAEKLVRLASSEGQDEVEAQVKLKAQTQTNSPVMEVAELHETASPERQPESVSATDTLFDPLSLKELDDEQLEQDLERHLAGLEKYERKLAEHDLLNEANSVLSASDVASETLVTAANALPVTHAEVISEADLHPACAERIWVLGASVGGPQAVKEFLACLPNPLPIAFIVAQHIGKGFVSLLSEQMGRICSFDIVHAASGRPLANNQLMVAPTDKKITFNHAGELIMRPLLEKTRYAPSIDLVLQSVAESFGPRAGAIIFSGMGDDGKQGVKVVAGNRGMVWAQSPESCVISSMADHARDTGCVQFSGSPAELAHRLVEFLSRVSNRNTGV